MVMKLKKVMIYLLCCALVVQLFFIGTSDKSKASHAWDARLGLRIVTKPIMERDDSRPYPFNARTGTNHAVLGMKQTGKTNYEISYCMDYGLGAWTNDYLTSNYSSLSADDKVLLNYTMLYGYNAQSIVLKNVTTDQINRFFATQSLVWIIREGYFYKDTERAKIEAFFKRLYPDSADYYKTLYKTVKYMASAPSYATSSKTATNVNTMKWNSSNKCYELTLTNTFKDGSYSANNTVTVDKSTLPSGVTVSVSGEKIVIKSTKNIDKTATIRLVKNTNKKGQLVAWTNSVSTRQSQITLDYDEKPYEKEAFINIVTEKKASLKIVKTSTDKVISGVNFTLTDTSSKGTQSYTTGKDGVVDISQINAGTYTVSESQNNLSNYLKVADQKVTLEPGGNKTLTFNNIRKLIRINIKKISSADSGNALVDGSVYTVYKDGVKLQDVTVSGGKATTDYSYYDVNSVYTVKEIKAATGTQLDTKVYNVDTSAVAKSTVEKNTVDLPFDNKVISNEVKIVKTLEKGYFDKTNNLPGKNIQFKLTLKSNTSKTYTATTDVNGVATFSKVPYGVYKVEEVKAPAGYNQMDSFEVNVTSATAGAYVFTKVNTLIKGSVNITKTLELTEYDKKCGVTKKYGENIKFVANPVVDGKVNTSVAVYSEGTNKKGQTSIANLTYGTWQISEVKETVPQGYISIDPVNVTISKNGDVKTFEFEDKVMRGNVSITKTLEKTDLDKTVDVKYASGVKFIAKPIINGKVNNSVVIQSAATNAKGQTSFANLTFGDWQISEVTETVPAGYLPVEPFNVAITKNGDKVSIAVIDEAIKGNVAIAVIDKTNKLPIPGTEIVIYNANGDEVFRGKTDKDGRITTVLYYGKYTYKQVGVVDGYVQDTNIYNFAITQNNQLIEKTIINDRVPEAPTIVVVKPTTPPPTTAPPTSAPPTTAPPTTAPPTTAPPTSAPPTTAPATTKPATTEPVQIPLPEVVAPLPDPTTKGPDVEPDGSDKEQGNNTPQAPTTNDAGVENNDGNKDGERTTVELYDKNGTYIGSYTADETGNITFGVLEDGDYYYVYVDDINHKKHYFTIKNKGQVVSNNPTNNVQSVTIGQDKESSKQNLVTILDEDTPKTGDKSNLKVLYITTIVTGLALVIMVVTEVVNKRRRRV